MAILSLLKDEGERIWVDGYELVSFVLCSIFTKVLI